MSLPEQTPVAYPHSIVTAPSTLSRGAFGPVFVVLAVITALAAIACFVGRILARRYLEPMGRRERAFDSASSIEDGLEMDISPPMRITKGGEAKAMHNKPAQLGGFKEETMSPAAAGGLKFANQNHNKL